MSKSIIIILMDNDSDSTIDLLENIKDYQSLEKIVVVDNCSTNDSYEIVKKYENEHIHVIKTQANDGIAKGNNLGSEYEKSICPDVEHYIFSNPEVIVYEEILWL